MRPWKESLMAIYSCHLSMVRRSHGESAVAGVAYNARDVLWDEYRGLTQNFVHAHSHERVVVDLGVMAPDAAPDEWRAKPAMPDDAIGRRACHEARLVLWNAAEAAERSEAAQTARRIMVALPRELTVDQQLSLGRRVMAYYVAQGRVADGVIHDARPGGTPNPHLHLQLTVRPCDTDGFASYKRRNAYCVRDADGHEAVLLPDELRAEVAVGHAWEKTYHYDLKNGSGKRIDTVVLTPSEASLSAWEGYERRNKHPLTVKRDVMPWNEQANAERWRADTAELINSALREANIDARVDHRSYERQGLDRAPQLHEGGAVVALERHAKAKAQAAGVEYVPVTEVRRQNLEIAAINSAADLEREIQAYRDALADACSDTSGTETVADLVGSEVAERFDELERRAVVQQAAEDQTAWYPPARVSTWSDRMERIADEVGVDRRRYDDDTLVSRFHVAARRAHAWAARAHEYPTALSNLLGGWGEAWSTVRRAFERTSEITRLALSGPAIPWRSVIASVRKAMSTWVAEHRSAIDDGVRGSSSSSPAAPSTSAPSPSRGISR